MKINSFLPFGFFSKEAGLISLISNYIKIYDLSVTQMISNGVVSACPRDVQTGWQQNFNSSMQCIAEQCKLAAWSGSSTKNLSVYLHPQEVDQSKRWILSLHRDNLLDAEFEGLPLGVLSQYSIRQQFPELDLQSRSVEVVVRRILLSAARIARIFKNYAIVEKPDYVLMAGGQDFMSSVARLCLKQRKIPVSLFCYAEDTNEIVVENPGNGKVSSYPLVFDDVTTFRTDPRSWPPELVKTLEELIAFIELTPSQIALPIASAMN